MAVGYPRGDTLRTFYIKYKQSGWAIYSSDLAV